MASAYVRCVTRNGTRRALAGSVAFGRYRAAAGRNPFSLSFKLYEHRLNSNRLINITDGVEFASDAGEIDRRILGITIYAN